MNTEQRAKSLIEDLLDEGFDHVQILQAMTDGEYLKRSGLDQELVEEIYYIAEKAGQK